MKQATARSTRTQIKELILYFTLAFVIAWASWFPSFLHPNTYRLLSFVGLFAPAIAACIVSLSFDGKQGLAGLFGHFRILHFAPSWYVAATLLVPSLFAAAIWFDTAFSKMPLHHFLLPTTPSFVVISFIWLMFINSGEEIGWRGFALPRMLKLMKSPLYASLLLGLFWGAWHLPIYLVPGQSSIPLPLFLLFTIGLSVLYTVIFTKTKGSLVSVVLLHASTDIVPRVANITQFSERTWVVVALSTWICALVFYFIFRERRQEIPSGY